MRLYAKMFLVLSESTKYQLHNSGYLGGLAGDSLSIHNNMKFTTKDRDDDDWYYRNYAKDLGLRKGACWRKGCIFSAVSMTTDPDNTTNVLSTTLIKLPQR